MEKGAETGTELAKLSLDPRANICDHEIMKHRDRVMKFVSDEWAINFKNHIVSNPLYPTEIVTRVASKVINAWLEMEKYFEGGMEGTPPGSSGGKVLLTGTKGVGKTTLMKGLYAIVKKYCKHTIPIFRNFEEREQCFGPSSMLVPPFSEPFTTDSYWAWSLANRKGLIFFGDEFDYLYGAAVRDVGVPIAKEILSLGKSNVGFGIISGSSSALKSLAHKEDETDTRHDGFPNLNHTVYVEYRLNPIRSSILLEAVLKLKCQESLLRFADQIFAKTGGVGRYLDGIRSVDDLREVSLPDILDVVDNLEYGVIIRNLYVKNIDWNIEHAFILQGLSQSQVRACFPIPRNTRRSTDKLIDLHFLHKNENGVFEFLFPDHVEILRGYFAGDISRLETLALECILRGWEGFGSAGQVLEPLILRTLVDARIAPFGSRTLSYGGNQNIRQMERLDALYNKVFIPTPDTGLDSFVLTRGEESNVFVDVSQIKCGARDKSITMGTQKSTDPSKFFTAILRHANVGWADLMSNLKSAFPENTFVLRSFSLFTNKSITDAVITEKSTVCFMERDVDLHLFAKSEFEEAFSDILRGMQILP
jgi:hypothetical protein